MKLAFVCATIAMTAPAAADTYPAKPVRIVVTAPPGATSDMLARVMAEQLGKALKVAFVVENRPGAGGNIAGDYVAKSTPDGYTLLLASVSSHAINPSLYTKMPYDPVKDFAPIIVLASNPNALVVSPASGIKSVADLVKAARARPGELSFSSGGNGTSQHLAGELFKSMTGVQLMHVPYKGSSEALTAVMRNETTLMFPNIPNALALAKNGNVTLLAVTTRNRLSWLPEVPTLHESGLPGFEAVAWFGLVAPAGTPRGVVDTLNNESARILARPDVQQQLIGQGFDIMGGSPEAFQTFLKTEIEKWRVVVRQSGATVN
ncbi:MAG: tripartite tricarboxylate transporter substrate binding protein [Alcaligenaceae bacterium]|nr:tripartite tricarboxylate transporter substrate binding protein [Alcaligenaceae bacterium SAGV5]MPS28359.1 tripartite tricarboxylate transporter substrate binding protein [Alcaligenaceae bacterium SAGV5]MPS51434.1 tripartite tricarboxylate transporter substrate binding protein [Alcaligenaceae bacterium SAGV3]MPT56002.1 tripartite tricarboxylate transporter substrate binding protein [Alcaligenaceae bacterium]